MIETMGAYQLQTGFKPMGPYRQMVHDFLDSRMHTCPQCQGRGVIDAETGENYQICPTCKMTQYVFDGSPEEWQTLHEQIKSKYPGEAVISRATG
jgi:DnaJ-class molecular chaperone